MTEEGEELPSLLDITKFIYKKGRYSHVRFLNKGREEDELTLYYTLHIDNTIYDDFKGEVIFCRIYGIDNEDSIDDAVDTLIDAFFNTKEELIKQMDTSITKHEIDKELDLIPDPITLLRFLAKERGLSVRKARKIVLEQIKEIVIENDKLKAAYKDYKDGKKFNYYKYSELDNVLEWIDSNNAAKNREPLDVYHKLHSSVESKKLLK